MARLAGMVLRSGKGRRVIKGLTCLRASKTGIALVAAEEDVRLVRLISVTTASSVIFLMGRKFLPVLLLRVFWASARITAAGALDLA